MEVIILQNIRNLGKIGEVVKVKDGYGRNFLIKTGKALRADDENKIIFQKKKDEMRKKIKRIKKLQKISLRKSKTKINFQKETKETWRFICRYQTKRSFNLIVRKI